MMSASKPTIYDVAKAAGVSIATVSRVINSSSKVNPETRAAVLATIDELGFIPNAESRARALRGTNRIGVLIPFFTAPSFVQRLRGITAVLSRENYEMVIFPVSSRSQAATFLETLPLNRNLDGIIIVSQAFDSTVSKRLVDNKLEAVLIEFTDPNFCSVQIDDEEGGYLAAKYLINKGYRRFAFIGDINKPIFGVDPITPRLEGFRKGLLENNFELPDFAIYPNLPNAESPLKDIISRSGYPLAIFTATDMQAFAQQKEARLLGLSVPQDVAILGFDNLDMADYVGLSTIHQPLDDSGKIATELLLSRIRDPNRSVQHIKLPLKIIERETT